MIVKLLSVDQISGEIMILAHRMRNDVASGDLKPDDARKLYELSIKLACLTLGVKNQALGQDVPAHEKEFCSE
jgi:hypothetical protein